METSPIPPEWRGTPRIIFIIDTTISMDHDFAQSPVIGANRVRFIQLIEKYFTDWYITPLIKCKPKNLRYSSKEMKLCTNWIDEEIKRVKPEIIVGCGSKVPLYINCDYETMSPVRIVQSKKHEEIFEGILKQIKESVTSGVKF